MLKKALIAVLILLIIVAGVAYYVFSNIDSIAKDLIERSGRNVIGTEVSVESVSIDLNAGRATIVDLAVANPPGYSDHPAFRFSEVTAVIDIGSGVVKSIFSSQPEIRIEFKGDESNFGVLQENIRNSAPQVDAEQTPAPESPDDAEGEVISLQIDEVVVEQARATVISDQAEPLQLTINRLRFQNLTGSPEQIARVALGQFVAQVLAAAARKMLEDKAEQILEQQSGQVMDKLEKLLNQ